MSSLSNPKSFWNKLKRLSNSQQQTPNGINKEQWVKHFEKLFQDRPNPESNDENQDLDNNQYDVTKGELEDIVFNSDITDKETLKAMKRGKSAGIDELIPEFFMQASIIYYL